MTAAGESFADGPQRRLVSVVLNYNSADDVEQLVPQLLAQEGVDHAVIVVDNKSSERCAEQLRVWAQRTPEVAFVGSPEGAEAELDRWTALDGRVALVLNSENRGYSAGNNVGMRLAMRTGAEAILVANPDMRIDDPGYIGGLARVLFTSDKNLIAASRVLDLERSDQNPLREPQFWEELLWPLTIAKRVFASTSYVVNTRSSHPVAVAKVSGCCMLVRSSFLHHIGGLDENVFLYCEEPILSAQVRRAGGLIIHVPHLSAIHAHVRSSKENSSTRMLHFIRSRNYYVRAYSGYSYWQRILLRTSYGLLAAVHQIKRRLSRAR